MTRAREDRRDAAISDPYSEKEDHIHGSAHYLDPWPRADSDSDDVDEIQSIACMAWYGVPAAHWEDTIVARGGRTGIMHNA